MPAASKLTSDRRIGHLPGGSSSSTSNDINNAVYSQSGNSDDGLPHPKVKYDDDKFNISLDCSKYKPEELDVKVENNSIIITAQQEIKESGGTRTRVFEQKFTLPSGVKAEKVTSSYAKDGTLNITAPRGGSTSAGGSSSFAPVTYKKSGSDLESRMDRVMSPSSWDDRDRHISTSSHSSTSRNNPISRPSMGGHELMSSTHHFDDGISKVKYEDDTYKIIIDARDFRPEDLVVKTVGQTVQFEANHEERTSDGHSFSSRNISQSFTLPKGVKPEDISSSMSKDGYLTIAAPLPPGLRAAANTERLIPIKQR